MLNSCLVDVFDPVYGTGYVRVKMALRPASYEEYFFRSIWVGGSQKILGNFFFLTRIIFQKYHSPKYRSEKKAPILPTKE